MQCKDSSTTEPVEKASIAVNNINKSVADLLDPVQTNPARGASYNKGSGFYRRTIHDCCGTGNNQVGHAATGAGKTQHYFATRFIYSRAAVINTSSPSFAFSRVISRYLPGTNASLG